MFMKEEKSKYLGMIESKIFELLWSLRENEKVLIKILENSKKNQKDWFKLDFV